MLFRQHIIAPKMPISSGDVLSKYFPMELLSSTSGGSILDELTNYHEHEPPFQWNKSNFKKFAHHYMVLLEVPGIPKEKLHVTVTKDTVTVKGAHKICVKTPKGKETVEVEFSIPGTGESITGEEICIDHRIERTFKLPPDINHEKVEAKIKDGVLMLLLERTEGFEKELKINDYDQFYKVNANEPIIKTDL